MTDPEIHSQQQRENPEPQEGSNPMPWFVLLLTAALLVFGIVYIVRPGGDAGLYLELPEAVPAADTSAAAPSPRATLFPDEPRPAAREMNGA